MKRVLLNYGVLDSYALNNNLKLKQIEYYAWDWIIIGNIRSNWWVSFLVKL